MTQVTKPVTRETAAVYRRRSLVVTLHPRHLELREKGTQGSVTVDYATVYELALKLRWQREHTRGA